MGHITVVTDHGVGDDLVFEIQLQVAVVVEQQVKKVLNVLAEHLAGMERHGGGHVGGADDQHTVFHHR